MSVLTRRREVCSFVRHTPMFSGGCDNHQFEHVLQLSCRQNGIVEYWRGIGLRLERLVGFGGIQDDHADLAGLVGSQLLLETLL